MSSERASGKEDAMALERAENKEDTMSRERANGKEDTIHIERLSGLPALVDAALAIEKIRIQAQVRQSHLALQGRGDSDTDEVLHRLEGLEEYVDGRVADFVQDHPAWSWLKRIKGIGKENIPKVLGLIDIEKDDTASSLWSFAGYGVVDGHAPKRVKGQRLPYNALLRTLCWRVGESLMRARGKYYAFYLQKKRALENRLEARGVKIVPSAQLPKGEDGRRREGPGFISEGHVHNMALRLMIKLFLAHLWVVWREAEGLPVRPCYAAEKLGHTGIINPLEMVDR